MKMLKMALATLFFISFTGCSRQFKIARVVPGQTYIDTAVYILDEPDIAEISTLNTNHQVFIWRDVTLQVNKQDIVTAVHRMPASHETSLQYWKQHFRDEKTTFQKMIPRGKSQESLWVYDIPSHGVSAVYNEKLDEVTKVILYEY